MSDTNNTAAPSSITAPSEGPSPSEVLAFDPFAPKPGDTETPAKTPDQTGETEKPAEVDGGEPQVGADGKPLTPTPTPTPPATPAQVPPQADLSQLTQAIRDAVSSGQQKPAADSAPPAPRFNLGIPPEIMTALRSEDPAEFGTAMHAVVNGIANKVWTDFESHLQQQVLPQVGQIVQAHIQSLQQQAQVAQDFYGKHTTLNTPAARLLVQQAGVAVAQRRQAEGKPLAWSPELADEIAEEVYKSLPQLRPAPVVPDPKGKPNGGKPFATGTGARPAATGQKTPADEMMELIKG